MPIAGVRPRWSGVTAAPTLPMLPTTPQRATHDYERNGTCDLFPALNMATGDPCSAPG